MNYCKISFTFAECCVSCPVKYNLQLSNASIIIIVPSNCLGLCGFNLYGPPTNHIALHDSLMHLEMNRTRVRKLGTDSALLAVGHLLFTSVWPVSVVRCATLPSCPRCSAGACLSLFRFCLSKRSLRCWYDCTYTSRRFCPSPGAPIGECFPIS